MINHLVLSSLDNIHKMTVELHILQLSYSDKSPKFSIRIRFRPPGTIFLSGNVVGCQYNSAGSKSTVGLNGVALMLKSWSNWSRDMP